MIVEDVTLPLLVDTGATASLLNLETYNKFLAHHPLSAPSSPLLGYGNAAITIMGSVLLPVKYGGQALQMFKFHVSHHGANLMGLGMFLALGFTIQDDSGTVMMTVTTLIQHKYPALFHGLGCLTSFAHQQLIDAKV